jgi:hypothetical protein
MVSVPLAGGLYIQHGRSQEAGPNFLPRLAAHLFDMTFLVMLHGRLRTVDEYSGLLGQAGFRLQRVVPTESDVSILEAFVA